MTVCTRRTVPVVLGRAKWKVRPWWKATAPGGTSTNDRLDPLQLAPGQRVVEIASPVKMFTNS